MTIAYFLTCDDTAFAEPLMPRLIERAGVLAASLFTPDKAEDPYVAAGAPPVPASPAPLAPSSDSPIGDSRCPTWMSGISAAMGTR